MRKFILIFFTLFSLYACAGNSKSTTQGATMYKTRTEIFGEKPVYRLRVKADNAEVIAKINGVEIYRNFSGNRAFGMVTVNQYIASKNNTVSITLLTGEKNKLSSKAWGCATLEVYAEGKHFVLNRVCIDRSEKNPLSDSTLASAYSYDPKRGLYRDLEGKIEVGKTTLKPETMYQSDKINGIKAVQPFSLPTPFPRWKFLDSPDIIESTYDYLDEKEYEALKNTPKIKALYALDAKIRDALRAKDPERIIDLFKERFEENAHAFYDTPQALRQELLQDLKDTVSNPDKEFIERKGDELYFVIEENRKLAWLKAVSFYDKKTKIYSHYNIKYRLNDKGEWVITK